MASRMFGREKITRNAFRRQGLAVLTVLALTLGQAAALVEDTANGHIDWAAGTITVKGSGAPPDKGGAAQKRLMTKRAATADAYRQLAEIIKGVQVTSETTVENFVATNDSIKTQVSAFIKGARLGEVAYLSDGSAEISVTAPLMGQGGLSEIILPAVKQSAPPGSPPPGEGVNAPNNPSPGPGSGSDEKFTGLVIDARQVKLRPALAPTIRDESGARVYDAGIPLADVLARNGSVIYVVQDAPTSQGPQERRVLIAALPGSYQDGDFLAFNLQGLWDTIKKGFQLFDTVTQVVNRVGDHPIVAQLVPRPENTNLVDMIIPQSVNQTVQKARGIFDFLEMASVAIVGSK